VDHHPAGLAHRVEIGLAEKRALLTEDRDRGVAVERVERAGHRGRLGSRSPRIASARRPFEDDRRPEGDEMHAPAQRGAPPAGSGDDVEQRVGAKLVGERCGLDSLTGDEDAARKRPAHAGEGELQAAARLLRRGEHDQRRRMLWGPVQHADRGYTLASG
jgi:hypothetical protein